MVMVDKRKHLRVNYIDLPLIRATYLLNSDQSNYSVSAPVTSHGNSRDKAHYRNWRKGIRTGPTRDRPSHLISYGRLRQQPAAHIRGGQTCPYAAPQINRLTAPTIIPRISAKENSGL